MLLLKKQSMYWTSLSLFLLTLGCYCERCYYTILCLQGFTYFMFSVLTSSCCVLLLVGRPSGRPNQKAKHQNVLDKFRKRKLLLALGRTFYLLMNSDKNIERGGSDQGSRRNGMSKNLRNFPRIPEDFRGFPVLPFLCYKKDCFKKLAEWLDMEPYEKWDLNLKFYARTSGDKWKCYF